MEKADIIFVLEEGRIVEKGSFRDLLSRKDGAFVRLHQSSSFLSLQNGGGGGFDGVGGGGGREGGREGGKVGIIDEENNTERTI